MHSPDDFGLPCHGHYRRRFLRSNGGFTLVQLSLLLMVAGLMGAAMLPGDGGTDWTTQLAVTKERMARIEQATMGFMAENGRRPCPADASVAAGTATFGQEAAQSGSCTGGAPAASFTGSGADENIVAGGVPTASLGIPDEYAMDGFGRRITYVVDRRATKKGTCRSIQGGVSPTVGYTGDVEVYDTKGGALISKTMWLLLSHGADGHGAFPAQGSSVANRINIGSADADTLDNASADIAFVPTFDRTFVQKERTTGSVPGFDDLAWYLGSTQNQCCAGRACLSAAARFDGMLVNEMYFARRTIVTDFNGDGYEDIVVSGTGVGGGGVGGFYVLFGRSRTWEPYNVLNPTFLAGSGGRLTGARFLAPTNNYRLGYGLASGDINGDGYNDIVASSSYNSAFGQYSGSAFVVYGGPTRKDGVAWASTQTLNAAFLNGTGTAVNGFRLDGEGAYAKLGDAAAVGDVNGDGLGDVILGAPNNNIVVANAVGTVYIVYGGPTRKDGSAWLANQQVNAAFLNGSSTAVNGFALVGETAGDKLGFSMTAGDLNQDGKDDIILKTQDVMPTGYGFAGGSSVYVIWGTSSRDSVSYVLNEAFLNGGGSGLNGTRFDPEKANVNGGDVAIGDFNGDTYLDLLTGAASMYGANVGSLGVGAAGAVYVI